MSDLTAFPATSAAGSAKNGPTINNTNIQLLLTNRIDTSDPAAPSNGEWWIRNDTPSRLVLKVRQNGATVNGILTHILEENLDCDGNQLVNLLAEKLAVGSLPSPSSANEARFCYDETNQRWVLLTDTTTYYVAMSDKGATMYRAIECRLDVVAIASDPATADVNTVLGGWLMDATAKTLNVIARERIPSGWTAANDLLLETVVLLAAAETAGDDIDMDLDWRSITPESADTPAKTVTAATVVNKDIGSTAIVQYAGIVLQHTIDHDDATNPVAAGDIFHGVLQRNTVGGAGKVAGVIAVSAELLVPIFNFQAQG